MATIAPMAEWKPFTGKGTTPLTHEIICAHTMVGKLMGSWSWANQPGNSYWHFGLGADGRLLQCQPLEYRSAANLEGNDRVIPIETEDGYPDGRTSDAGQVWPAWSGSDVPAWTSAQLDKLVELIAWLCKKYNIPPVLIPDTLPGRRGLAYHRQGIDPWRVSGGEKWSLSTGKVCPGDRRIAQFTAEVIPRVQALVNGDDVTPTDLADILAGVRAETQRLAQYLAKGESNLAFPAATWGTGTTNPELLAAIQHAEAAIPTIGDIDVAALAAAIVAAMPPVPSGGVDQATVEAGVRAVVPEIAAAVIAEIAS